MTNIRDRYASSIHSGNLKTDERTVMGDTDVLGAMGLADRALTEGRQPDGTPVFKAPLAVPLARLFEGDNRAAFEVVRLLADLTWDQSFVLRVKIDRIQARTIACAVLAWHRHGTCTHCDGHGKTPIPGTGERKTLSDHDCQPCKGTGRLLFEQQFAREQRELARWVASELERCAGRAFDMAARKIASRLDL